MMVLKKEDFERTPQRRGVRKVFKGSSLALYINKF